MTRSFSDDEAYPERDLESAAVVSNGYHVTNNKTSPEFEYSE